MASAQENTKIELVTESIEALVLASIRLSEFAGQHVPTGMGFEASFKNVADARTNLADALRELLKPTLRVVCGPESELPKLRPAIERNTVEEHVPYGGKGIDGMNLA